MSSKLDQIFDGVKTLKSRSEVFDKISNIYECVVCKDVMRKPQFGPCCNRIVGCQQRWCEDHDTCPHCSSQGVATSYIDVRGMDEMLSVLRMCSRHSTSNVQSHAPPNDSSDSDFEFPAVTFRSGRN